MKWPKVNTFNTTTTAITTTTTTTTNLIINDSDNFKPPWIMNEWQSLYGRRYKAFEASTAIPQVETCDNFHFLFISGQRPVKGCC